MGGVEYQVTKVDPTDPETKGMVYQVHKVSEEVAATLGGKVYRARIIKDPTEPTVAGKVYQIVLIGDPDDPAVKGKVYNAILTGDSEVVVVGPAVSPLSLPDAIADSLSYVKAFGGTEQRNLPDGYTALEYIESSGTQYIDLDVSGDATFIGTAQSTTDSPTTSQVLAANSGASAGHWFGVQSPSAGSSFAKRWGLGATATASSTIDGTTKVDFEITFTQSSQYGTVNDQVLNRESSTSAHTNWVVFAGDTTPSYGFIGKVWGLKVVQNDVLVRNFIPAKNSSNVVGMYDTVSGTFFTNAGTGDFVAGDPVVPTPTAPIPITCNNGVLKYGKPIMLDSTRYYAYLSVNLTDWSYSSDSYSIPIPVTVGHKYKITVPTTNPLNGVQNTIFRYAFTDSINTDWTSSTATGQTSIPAYDMVRTNPQDTPSVEITATHPYMIIQMGANVFSYILANNLITITDQSIYVDGTVETINAHGKNLFDPTKVLFGYYRDRTTGNKMQNSSNFMSSDDDYIPCLPNTNYTFVGTNKTNGTYSKYNTIYFFDSAKNYLGASPYELSQPTTGTTPSNCRYLQVRSNPLDNSTPIQDAFAQFNWQLEQGSAVTDYEPYYNGGTATAEMLLKVGDYEDVQEIIDGTVTRKVGVLVLDGTEEIWGSVSQTPDYVSVLTNCYTVAIPLGDAPIDKRRVYCTHLNSSDTLPDADSRQGFALLGNGGSGTPEPLLKKYAVGLGLTTRFPTIAGLKQWLAAQYAAGTPVIIVYPLATPTTESVAGQTLQVQAGDNTLEITQASIDGLELEAEYEKEGA